MLQTKDAALKSVFVCVKKLNVLCHKAEYILILSQITIAPQSVRYHNVM